jgi:hypothetical protein
MFDEIATEKRPRWDYKQDKFLGICQEHGHLTNLDFKRGEDLDHLFEELDMGEIHYASEVSKPFCYCNVNQ